MNEIKTEEYKIDEKYYKWILKKELFSSKWNYEDCKNSFYKFMSKYDSIRSRKIYDVNYFFITRYFIKKLECQGVYCYDRTKNKVHNIIITPINSIVSEFIIDDFYYFIKYNPKDFNIKTKYIEKGLLLISRDSPYDCKKYMFKKNFSPQKIEKRDSLFCITVYEYETEWRWGWTIFNTIFFWARGKPREYVHKYINSYMYKFDENLNLIEIEKLPLDMEEWKWSRKF